MEKNALVNQLAMQSLSLVKKNFSGRQRVSEHDDDENVLSVQRSSSWIATEEKPAIEEHTYIKWHSSQNGKKNEKERQKGWDSIGNK